MKRKIIISISLGIILFFCKNVQAATYYIPDDFSSIQSAFAGMVGGDTLIIRDGIYSGESNVINTSNHLPKGSAGNYTIVRAENDGAVLFDGEGSFNMFSVTPSTVADYYWQFEGLLWANNPGTNVGVLNSRYIKFLRCGAYNAGIGNNVNFSAGGGSEFILFENCYAFGSGRYKFLSYMASKIIFRQCVGRMDWCNAINDPIGIFAIYSCDDVEVQNCIAIDSDTSAYWSGDTQNIGGFGLPSTNQDTNRVTIDSCISLNLALGGSWITGSEYGRCNDIIIKNSVYWDCTQKSGQSIYQFRGFGDEVENCTFGVATHDYYCFESYNAIGMVNNTSIKNSIIYNYVGNPGLFYDIESEGYNCLYANYNNYAVNTAQGAYTTLTINPVWNVSSNSNGALKYIVKIESGSSLSLQGEGSVDIGANVTTFVGVSGTQWGDTDYNIETGVSMWPFPNEDLIRSKMKVYTGGGVSGDRGFCADGQTLTKYIWEYLGNTMPADIYGPDTIAPAAVSNLAAVSGSNDGEVDLTCTAPGDNGSSGTANSYDLRYNTHIITDINWGTSTQISTEPAPSSAGTTETLTVSGLTPGQTYYFAIKSQDEVPNVSALSNVVSAEAKETVVVSDTTPPYTTGHSPAKSATNILPNTPIIVHVKDDGAGVDINTIVMRVNGQVVTPTITGAPADYTLTYEPPADFNYGAQVNIEVQASDLAP